MRTKYTVYLIISMFVWIILFILGISINSSFYIDSISSSELFGIIKNIAVILISWTWSNVLILSCLSSSIGELGRQIGDKEDDFNLRTSITRGFFVFLGVAMGQLVIAGGYNPSNESQLYYNISQGAYFRIACFISLISLLFGYNPRLFFSWIHRLEKLTGIRGNKDNSSHEWNNASLSNGVNAHSYLSLLIYHYFLLAFSYH